MQNDIATKQDLQSLEARMDAKFEAHSKQIITEVSGLIHDLMDRFDERFTRLETRMDALEERMGRVEKRMDGLETRMTAVESRLTGVEKQLTVVEARLADVEGRVTAVESDVKELYHLVDRTYRKYDVQLREQPEQEARLRKVEAFARAAADKIGVKIGV